jgi:N-acetylglucosaminyldiphosphoundecaprenol N-acetyl-beta-D-mannosaminyltransferase
MIAQEPLPWPDKHNLFGVGVSATDYRQATDLIVQAGSRRQAAVVTLHAAHALICASNDPVLRKKVNAFEIVATDGQPVRWALNWLYRAGLADRVYGPELMLRICEEAARRGVSIYLYGSSPSVIENLSANLVARFPGIQIAGAESPPFRDLTAEETDAMCRRVNESGAGIVFVGLGAPKQDHFGHDHRDRIKAVQVCVGAAFDFHAGVKKVAPDWMQRSGLEWLFRLTQEPKRLWRRYLVTNSQFVAKFLWQASRQPFRRKKAT